MGHHFLAQTDNIPFNSIVKTGSRAGGGGLNTSNLRDPRTPHKIRNNLARQQTRGLIV
jgi:hypothetical protein